MTNGIYIPELLSGVDEALLAECDEYVKSRSLASKTIKKRKPRYNLLLVAALMIALALVASAVFVFYRVGIFGLPADTSSPIPPESSADIPADNYFVIENGVLLSYTGSETEVTIPEGVTEISADAFAGNTTLRVLTLSSTVSSIADGCLAGCENLEELRVAENGAIRASEGLILSSNGKTVIFANNESVSEHLIIPEGVEKIDDRAFSECTGLKSVVFPSTLDSIGKAAFSGCPSLTEISLGGTRLIGQDAFYHCSALSKVDFDETQTIGFSAFAYCSSLREIELTNVKLVGEKAFYRAGIEKIDFGYNVGRVNESAFESCKLTEIYIPVSMNYIASFAFKDCKIKTVYYRGNQTQWNAARSNYIGISQLDGYELILLNETPEDIVFELQFISNGDGTCTVAPPRSQVVQGRIVIPEKSPSGDTVTAIKAFNDCSLITEVIIPATVTELPDNAFSYCTSLERVEIPGVAYLGKNTFRGCYKLSDIKLNTAIKNIPEGTFEDCRSLSELVIHEGVLRIGMYALRGCAVEEFVLPSTLLEIGHGAFGGAPVGTGAEYDYPHRVDLSATKVTVLSNCFGGCVNLREVILPETLESIENQAFNGCKSLASIELPHNLKKIGYSAFYGCSSLSELALPAGLETIDEGAFGKTAIKNLTVPASVTGIYRSFAYMPELEEVIFEKTPEVLSGFYNSGIKRIVIPEGVKRIDAEAFAKCESLTEIVFAASVREIGESAFAGCTSLESVSIPDTVKSAERSLFNGCSSLKEFKLSKSFDAIGNRWFYGCTSLKTLVIPEGIVTVDEEAFAKCTSLISVTLPKSLRSIGDGAFAECAALKELVGDGVESLGNKAFYDCGFESLKIPDSVKSIGESCFERCEELRELTFSKKTETLGRNAFYECYGLESVVMAGTIKELPYQAFGECYRLKNIVFPPSIEIIGGNCFQGCRGLEKLTTPASLVSIERYAFEGCKSLTELILTEGVEYIGENAFSNISITELRLPASLKYIGLDAFWTMNYSTLKTVYFARSSAVVERSFRDCDALEKVVFEDPTDMEFGSAFYMCDSLKTVEILSGTLNAGSQMFEDCRSLSEIDFSKLSAIGTGAFEGCTSLPSEIVIPESIRRLPQYAFIGCTSIEKIVFPLYFEHIDAYAFDDCTSLREITLGLATSVNYEAIRDCTALSKVIYPGTEEMYKDLVSSSDKSLERLNAAEKVYLDSFPIAKGYTLVCRYGKFKTDQVSYTVVGDPFTLNVIEEKTNTADYGDKFSTPYILARGEKQSIVRFFGQWILIDNSKLAAE